MPIEPQSSTEILDKLLEKEYVYYAAVPGAGGNDAIFVIGEREGLHERVEEFCKEWNAGKRDRVAVLPVRVVDKYELELNTTSEE